MISRFLIIGIIIATSAVCNELITNTCINCIYVITGSIDKKNQCEGFQCGPYRITAPYWYDANNFSISYQDVLNNETYRDEFVRCTSDTKCAANIIRSYTKKYSKDCNNDNFINCEDYIRIHILGAFGCQETLPSRIKNLYNVCLHLTKNNDQLFLN